jgi:alkylation response protein AidB-like acyl-CoA dehydrogenase
MTDPSTGKLLQRFGDPTPFCEPAHCQGFFDERLRASHWELRAKCRKFVEEELIPNREQWLEDGGYPMSIHEKAYEAGIGGVIFPKEWGGTPPDDYDAFHEMIILDEFARCGAHVFRQLSINSMALPPIIHYGSQYLKEKVLRDVITGKKQCCLAISEPSAGSDVSGIETTAVLSEDGSHYVVNGQKKWITGGATGDFFTLAVRTGGEGHGGISLLLLERNLPGVRVRKMKTQVGQFLCVDYSCSDFLRWNPV